MAKFAKSRQLIPSILGAVATGIAILPKQELHAEAPPRPNIENMRKPIYDDLALVRTHTASPPTSASSATKVTIDAQSEPEAAKGSSHDEAKGSFLSSLWPFSSSETGNMNSSQSSSSSSAPDTSTLISTASSATSALTTSDEALNDQDDQYMHRSKPTDRLARHVGRARIFVHAHAALLEDRVNGYMSRLLDQERSFTETMASLAPSPESHERIMPGGVYVLVAAMAGSIVSRNRGIALRSITPLAFGIGAAHFVLPITSRNVGDLAWKYEQRVPVIAANHMRVRGAFEETNRQARQKGQAARAWCEQTIKDGRQGLERWTKQPR